MRNISKGAPALLRFTDRDALIDAIEVSLNDSFVTVYINSDEPGLPESVQGRFKESFKDILPNPGHHDPARFHGVDDPRGSKWRVWENKFGCHFHFEGDTNEIIQALLERADLSDKIRKEMICDLNN